MTIEIGIPRVFCLSISELFWAILWIRFLIACTEEHQEGISTLNEQHWIQVVFKYFFGHLTIAYGQQYERANQLVCLLLCIKIHKCAQLQPQCSHLKKMLMCRAFKQWTLLYHMKKKKSWLMLKVTYSIKFPKIKRASFFLLTLLPKLKAYFFLLIFAVYAMSDLHVCLLFVCFEVKYVCQHLLRGSHSYRIYADIQNWCFELR